MFSFKRYRPDLISVNIVLSFVKGNILRLTNFKPRTVLILLKHSKIPQSTMALPKCSTLAKNWNVDDIPNPDRIYNLRGAISVQFPQMGINFGEIEPL
jgi:hypothetical protein